MPTIKRYDECYFLNYNRCTDISLYEIGCQACPPSYSFGPIIRDHYVLHYVQSGVGTLYLNHQEYQICSHEAFVIPPNVVSYYQADAFDPWNYIWVHLDGPKTTEYFQEAGITKNNPVFCPTEYPNPMESIMKDLLQHHKKELHCIGKIYEMYDCILELSPARLRSQVDVKLQYVKKIIDYIHLKYNEQIHVEDIARSCGLERSYLTRLFKSATGYSPQEYLIVYRMRVACSMLTESNMPIQHIAYAVGYKDSFTFSKAFKKHMNLSPTSYREAQKSNPAQQNDPTGKPRGI